MFTKKIPKTQSTSKLLSILTKRSSQKRLSVRRGIYDQWPTFQKPSLINCSTNYIKYMNSIAKQSKQKQQLQNRNKNKKQYIKKPATFSTCTTMQFFPSNNKQNYLQNKQPYVNSKFTSTLKSQQSNQQYLLDNNDKYNNHSNKNNSNKQSNKFTPYMTPQQQSQIEQEQSHLKHNYEEYDPELNSKYQSLENKQKRPKTFNHNRKLSQQRRLVQTAKLHRQQLQIQQPNIQIPLLKKQSTSRRGSATYSRPTTAKTYSSTQQNQGFTRKNIYSKAQSINTNAYKQNIQVNYNYPMRLKDYETNFQAYKVISELIDEQMKWQPKRKRPKSSVMFRKYNVGLKA